MYSVSGNLSHARTSLRLRGLRAHGRLIEYVETPTDVWLVFEKGGESLSSLLFDVQGESYK